MINDDEVIMLPHGGIAHLANYKVQSLPEYIGNPLIEALPKTFNQNEYLDAATNYPFFNESERHLPRELRLQCVLRMTHYFQPLTKHIDLEQRISGVIRHGYLSRNPLHAQYVVRLRQIKESVKLKDINEMQKLLHCFNSSKSDPVCLSLLGISGVGKTTGLNSVLKLYPQVIVHHEYNGKPFNLYQVVWIRLECPHAGSLKGLCSEFFQEVDKLLGTDYYAKHGNPRTNSEDYMLGQMIHICYLHGIGFLFIDEIQNLCNAKSGGSDKVLNFLVKLINKHIAPIFFVGTNKAEDIFQSAFRQARRVTGMGISYWDRFRFNEEEIVHIQPENSEGGVSEASSVKVNIWKFLIKELFNYQWTKFPVAFDEEISKTLYDKSQGIADIAIKLYILAQWRAIAAGTEKITPSLISQVAADSLMLVQPMLNALRSNKIELIRNYSDIKPLNIDSFYEGYVAEIEMERIKALEESRERLNIKRRTSIAPALNEIILGLLDLKLPLITAQQFAEKVYAEQETGDTLSALIEKAFRLFLTDDTASPVNNSVVRKKKSSEKMCKKYIQGDLRLIVADAKKSQKPAYAALNDNGVIKSPTLELAI